MRGLCSPVSSLRRVTLRLLLICCLLAFAGGRLTAQSTFGAILGTVRDSSGALMHGAQVTLINTGTTATRTMLTDANGNYAFKNIDVGSIHSPLPRRDLKPNRCPGYRSRPAKRGAWTPRSSRARKPRPSSSSTIPRPSSPPTFPTWPRPRSATNWSSCPSPSTPAPPVPPAPSPRSPPRPACRPTTAATWPSGHHRRAAQRHHRRHLLGRRRILRPGQRDVSLLQLHRGDSRLSESNNNAEFSGVADITTVSKAGTNHYHGGVFENNENTV